MTRKHFAAIAAVIAKINDRFERQRTAQRMANELYEFNPNFDRPRFISACGAED